jgi:hypothetical protein
LCALHVLCPVRAPADFVHADPQAAGQDHSRDAGPGGRHHLGDVAAQLFARRATRACDLVGDAATVFSCHTHTHTHTHMHTLTHVYT